MSSNLAIPRICDHCSVPFTAKTSKTRFCSHDCNRKYYKAQQRKLKIELSASETLEKRVSKSIVEATPIMINEIMTVNDVAKILEYSKDAIYDLIKSGRLKASRPSIRKTRIKREDLMDYLDNTVMTDEVKSDKVSEPTIAPLPIAQLTVEHCYSIAHLIEMFGKGRDSLYRILRNGEVPFIKVGREVFYAKIESDQLFRRYSTRKYIGFVGHLPEVENNRRLAQKRFVIADCYTMGECEALFNDRRENLYGLFSRREVPRIKEGVQTYYLRKSVDRILRQKEKGGKSE